MLTVEQLKNMPPHFIFASGISNDRPDGLFMANTNRELRWVAVRGVIKDWCIYCHFSDRNADWIAKHGDKVKDKDHIKMLVLCDDEAFKLYRY